MFRFLFDKDTWQELRESLTKNKLRTIITMIGVWWGILLLIGLLGSAKGIENKFSVQFGDYATNSVFIWGQTTSKAFKGFQQGRYPGLKLSQLEKIKNLEIIKGWELNLDSLEEYFKFIRDCLF